jgi:uncharacterized protein
MRFYKLGLGNDIELRNQKLEMTRIGLISDTHSVLHPSVAEHFVSCDEIWHAGDIGDPTIIDQLKSIKPVKAVFGNIDDKKIRSEWPEDLWMEVEGVNFWMTHIGGSPPNYNPRIKKLLKEKVPDVFICGHSHILKVMKDKERNMLFINPGAAGNQGFHRKKTLVRFEVEEKKIVKLEVIELD